MHASVVDSRNFLLQATSRLVAARRQLAPTTPKPMPLLPGGVPSVNNPGTHQLPKTHTLNSPFSLILKMYATVARPFAGKYSGPKEDNLRNGFGRFEYPGAALVRCPPCYRKLRVGRQAAFLSTRANGLAGGSTATASSARPTWVSSRSAARARTPCDRLLRSQPSCFRTAARSTRASLSMVR